MHITREDYEQLLNPQFTPEQQALRARQSVRAQQTTVNFTPLQPQAEQQSQAQARPITDL